MGRNVQKGPDTLGRTIAGAVATELGRFTVRDVLSGLPTPTPSPQGE
ncbi:hypothetical protein V1L54_26610 [Streptomyces sp. TRM 70361]|nr:hypothetical protein [Streptomyces sp. TRM 70361]MEE1942938.1 hypothetical protein [Streptomyces sp. TRM 70361]